MINIKDMELQELADAILALDDDATNDLSQLIAAGRPHPNTGGTCPTGQHWDNILKKCVVDDGP